MPIHNRFHSTDGITTKYLVELGKDIVETSYVNRPEKHIVCFSTGVGCPIGCKFCCAGNFKRHLSTDELLAQCISVYEDARVGQSDKPVLFSAMGEGEPLLSEESLSALMETILYLRERIPNAKFALATTGIQPSLIRKLAEGIPQGSVKLQLSIHAPNDETRKQLIPVSRPLEQIIAGVRGVLEPDEEKVYSL